MRIALISLFMTPLTTGCGGEKGSTEVDECYSNDDCPEGQVCIISHDHEGDDHDHGGDCEDALRFHWRKQCIKASYLLKSCRLS